MKTSIIKLSKRISYLLVFLSLIFIFIFIFRTFIYDLNLSYYLKYYYFIGFFLIFAILSFYINDEIKINIFIFLSSIVLSLYILEAFLSYNEWKKRLGDKRSLTSYYKSQLNNYEKLATLIPPSAFLRTHKTDYFPLSLIPNYNIVACNENGEFIINQTDRYGFNSKDKDWDENTIDFILIGDSFTYGMCEKKDNNFGGHINKNLNYDSATINLGMPGNGPLTSFASLKEYYPKDKQVKNLIWFYYPNDWQNLSNEKKNPLLIKYIEDKLFLQNLKGNLNYHKEDYLEMNFLRNHRLKFKFLRLGNLKSLFQKLFYQKKNESIDTYSKDLELFLSIFKNIKAEYVDSNFYFVYLPSYGYYFSESRLIQDNSSKKLDNILLENLDSMGVNIINIDEVFEKISDKKKLFSKHKTKNHYSSYGYEIVAKEIIKYSDPKK